jgi:predicted TPR repeat methyltransferase
LLTVRKSGEGQKDFLKFTTPTCKPRSTASRPASTRSWPDWYRAPALLTQVAGGQLAAPSATLDVADLGCGTGLCGPWLKPWARHLAGCDLSTGMLQQAQRRQSYDALFKAELVHCLRCQPGRFDLLVCADTHCYFGDLQDSADAAVAALRPGGNHFYTVESALDGGGLPFHLRPSGRYVHAHHYVLDVVAGVGQRTLGMEGHALRQQAGVRVAGWVLGAQALSSRSYSSVERRASTSRRTRSGRRCRR